MSYCEHQEVAARVMVRLVKTKKKTLLKSMGVQVLSLNKMGTLMANISKFVNQIPIERMLTVNSKYYGTPRAH